jgi:hypothetical protein
MSDVDGMGNVFAGIISTLIGLVVFAAAAFLLYGFLVSFTG